ncbi:uncharacterized protein [Apostichopus japonicus]
MKVAKDDVIPHLCLYAKKKILPGEEITYDYGGYCPWRKKTTNEEHDEVPQEEMNTMTTNEEHDEVPQEEMNTMTTNEEHVEVPQEEMNTMTTNEEQDEVPQEEMNTMTTNEEHDEVPQEEMNTMETACKSTSVSFTESPNGALYFDADLRKYHHSLDNNPNEPVFLDEMTGNMYSYDICTVSCQEEYPELQPVFDKMMQQIEEQTSDDDSDKAIYEENDSKTSDDDNDKAIYEENDSKTSDDDNDKAIYEENDSKTSDDDNDKAIYEENDSKIPKRLRKLRQLRSYSKDDAVESDFVPFDEESDTSSEEDANTSDEGYAADENQPSTSNKVCVLSTEYTAPEEKSKRAWNRQHYCIYCEKTVLQIARHFKTHHFDESLVIKALNEPKKSKERNAIFEELRKKGDHAHNIKVFKEGKGQLLVYKRPQMGLLDAEDFIPCPDCHGYFAKRSLWRHQKNCTSESKNESKQTLGLRRAARVLLPTKADCSSKLQNILAGMKADNIVLTIRADPWLCKLGEHYINDSPNAHYIVSDRMRSVARLLLETQKLNCAIKSAKDLVNPCHFDNVISGVKGCCGFDDASQMFATPSLAKKLGQSLNVLADISIAEAIKAADASQENMAEQFLKLKKLQWNKKIATKIYKQQSKQKWQKPPKIPLTADTVKLYQLLSCNIKETKESLKTEVTTSLWRELASLTLTQLIMFNRRRPGETQNLKLEDYKQQTGQKKDFQDEIYDSLPVAQKIASKRLSLIMTRGKRDRGVPVMLTPNMKDSIEILNNTRELAGVDPQNPYIFACPSGESLQPLRGYDCLHKYAQQCGAQNPERLTATNMRKHLATLSQILNLSESELEQLANHLGHNISVHKEYYRLPQDVIFLAKVSKLLLTAEKGHIHKYQGKALADFEIDNKELLSDREMSDENESEIDEVETQEIPDSQAHTTVNTKYKKRVISSRTKWSKHEETAVMNDPQLKKAIKTMHPPAYKACHDARENNACLQNRSITQIKSKVWNIIQKKSKAQLQKEH